MSRVFPHNESLIRQIVIVHSQILEVNIYNNNSRLVASPGLSRNSPNGWGAAGSTNPHEPWRGNGSGHSGAGGVQGLGGGGGDVAGTSMGGGTPAALAKRKIGLDSFKIVRVIGKGSFGKVRDCVRLLFRVSR